MCREKTGRAAVQSRRDAVHPLMGHNLCGSTGDGNSLSVLQINRLVYTNHTIRVLVQALLISLVSDWYLNGRVNG